MRRIIYFSIMLFLVLATMNIMVSDTNAQDADTEALRKADIAWSKTAETMQMDQFYSYFLDDAKVLAPQAPVAEGKAAIKELVDGFFAMPGFSLKWEPTFVQVSASGDWGYTVGTDVMRFDGPDGKPVVDKGKYMTVWKKDGEGKWRVAADMFNTNEPMPEAH